MNRSNTADRFTGMCLVSGPKRGKPSRDWAKWNWQASVLTHGAWTMPCWAKAVSCSKILITTATAGLKGSWKKCLAKVGKEEIYNATGIQFMPINTLYQLFAARRQTPKLLEAAKHLLTIPDLFNYWLTGNAVCEFTNATTTQMVDPVKRTWATSLMQRLELPAHLPAPIVEPGSILGTLLPDIAGHSSLAGTPVIAPACHDTGSAVAAISARDGTAFLSSGTWSLLGTELDSPVITSDALRLNFTNEGGVNGTTRLLKNVMGLWMLRSCRQSWTAQGHSYDYRELIELAARCSIVSSPG